MSHIRTEKQRASLIGRNTTHGLSRVHPIEYRAWKEMRGRCLRPTVKHWERYGGRGISICERWVKDFAAFFADMGPKPSARHSIDRIDNDGNYEPGNCRWATPTEQANNKSKTHPITHNGVTKNLLEWCRDFGLEGQRSSIGWRIRQGWSFEDAFSRIDRRVEMHAATLAGAQARARSTWAKAKPVDATCAECGVAFVTTSQKPAKKCSKRCRQLLHSRTRREKSKRGQNNLVQPAEMGNTASPTSPV